MRSGSLGELGFDVASRASGRVVDLELGVTTRTRRAPRSADVQELLANPLIESFEIELVEA